MLNILKPKLVKISGVLVVLLLLVWLRFDRGREQLPEQLEPQLPARQLAVENPLSPDLIKFEPNADSISLPGKMPVFRVLPAPASLFSPSAVQSLAQALGFTSQASAKTLRKLIIYDEGNRHLRINTEAGTIRLSVDLTALSQKSGAIDENKAKSLLEEKLADFGLADGFWRWDNAQITAHTVQDGVLTETGLVSQLNFLALTPQPRIEFEQAELTLLSPFPIFAWVDSDLQIAGLSVWYPNLQGEGVVEKSLISLESAQQKIQQGEGIIKNKKPGESLVLTEVEIVYQVLASEIQDFSQPRFLRPFYRFYGESGEVLVEATD